VLEAWAAGLPVIASAVGGLGRLCAAHPDATLTFPPGDANLMDAALNRLLSSKQVRDNLVTAGFSAVRDYDWRTLSQKLVAFYREIC